MVSRLLLDLKTGWRMNWITSPLLSRAIRDERNKIARQVLGMRIGNLLSSNGVSIPIEVDSSFIAYPRLEIASQDNRGFRQPKCVKLRA
ncbi:unnamed protein product [Danaus chrysippus]|uniref:(African queen) hypothetical protein n=1 Tax=Danaus chrysippus TaxID=151541 RepID=A0A8J2VVA5_9NEOP|nr:unnamed protein product [Danaus chrysippus]